MATKGGGSGRTESDPKAAVNEIHDDNLLRSFSTKRDKPGGLTSAAHEPIIAYALITCPDGQNV